MSLLQEYRDMEAERQEEALKSRAHYKSVNLPGDRNVELDTDGVRARIEAMRVEKAKPNHEA